MRKLKIVMTASEMAPFAKTGGLADVVGSLPEALAGRGHEVSVIMPKYASIHTDMELFHSPMGVWMGSKQEWCAVYRKKIRGIYVYFIEHNQFFNRDGIYHDNYMNDFADNPMRFAFLSRAAMQLCIDKNYSPDIFHAHDWQTALLNAYLYIWDLKNTSIENAHSVLTIHNMAYQGTYSKENVNYMGIGWNNFTFDKFEDHDRVNMLKGGISFAEAVNTVSPTYAEEVISGQGYGLDSTLRSKGSRFGGILNGADYTIWNPETDNLIRANYTKDNMSGKWICKSHLQDRFGLERNYTFPIFGIISRFTYQKGYNLISQIIEKLLSETSIQIAVLGSGDKDIEEYFSYLTRKYQGKFCCHIGFSEELAHVVEAGSDFFLMPSLFEPCGLNQIYSLKYGTLPIVRNTGGLSDTVENCDVERKSGTGFKFYDFTPEALYGTILWVLSVYYKRPDLMDILRYKAMSQDFSWGRSAERYEQMYKMVLGIS